jgi:hypothetical protein
MLRKEYDRKGSVAKKENKSLFVSLTGLGVKMNSFVVNRQSLNKLTYVAFNSSHFTAITYNQAENVKLVFPP